MFFRADTSSVPLELNVRIEGRKDRLATEHVRRAQHHTRRAFVMLRASVATEVSGAVQGRHTYLRQISTWRHRTLAADTPLPRLPLRASTSSGERQAHIRQAARRKPWLWRRFGVGG